MKEYIIAFEFPVTESSERIAYQVQQKFVSELIRCKACKHFDKDEFCHIWEVYRADESYCDIAERKDEYVTLHHEDIHFIDEDAERAFYESLAERKEE